MNKHTPWPWFTDQYGHVYGWTESEGSRESVLLLDNRHSHATRADKNLIAAAPDLLAALELLLNPPESPTFYAAAKDQARAAIAKAKGAA